MLHLLSLKDAGMKCFPLEIPQELSGGAWTRESWAWEGTLGFLGTAPSGCGVTAQDGWPGAGQ